MSCQLGLAAYTAIQLPLGNAAHNTIVARNTYSTVVTRIISIQNAVITVVVGTTNKDTIVTCII